MDLIRAIQLTALRQVLVPDDEDDVDYHLRRIFRWYSREFSTPLERVEELPLAEVLTHYFESTYEDMEEADLEKERVRIIESPDDRMARLMREGREKVDEMDFIMKVEAEEQERIRKNKEAAEHKRQLAPEVRQPLKSGTSETVGRNVDIDIRPVIRRQPEAALPVARPEQVMKVTFGEDLARSDVQEADSLGSASSGGKRRPVFER